MHATWGEVSCCISCPGSKWYRPAGGEQLFMHPHQVAFAALVQLANVRLELARSTNAPRV
jgi:hypothetical protein